MRFCLDDKGLGGRGIDGFVRGCSGVCGFIRVSVL